MQIYSLIANLPSNLFSYCFKLCDKGQYQINLSRKNLIKFVCNFSHHNWSPSFSFWFSDLWIIVTIVSFLLFHDICLMSVQFTIIRWIYEVGFFFQRWFSFYPQRLHRKLETMFQLFADQCLFITNQMVFCEIIFISLRKSVLTHSVVVKFRCFNFISISVGPNESKKY